MVEKEKNKFAIILKDILEQFKKRHKHITFFNIDNKNNEKVISIIKALNEVEFKEMELDNIAVTNGYRIAIIIVNEKFHTLLNLLHETRHDLAINYQVVSGGYSAKILVRTMKLTRSQNEEV